MLFLLLPLSQVLCGYIIGIKLAKFGLPVLINIINIPESEIKDFSFCNVLALISF